jgi:hypothetical protein
VSVDPLKRWRSHPTRKLLETITLDLVHDDIDATRAGLACAADADGELCKCAAAERFTEVSTCIRLNADALSLVRLTDLFQVLAPVIKLSHKIFAGLNHSSI